MKKEHKNGFGMTGIIVVIAALAILGGGFLYFRELRRLENITAPTPVPATQNQQVREPAPTAPSAEINTTNWKTYRNEQYGFEFRYPPSWEWGGSNRGGLYLDGQQEGHIEIFARGNDLNFSDRPANLSPAEREKYKMNLDQFWAAAKNNDAFQNIKKTQLNGSNAYEVDFRTTVGEYGKPETFHEEIGFFVMVENENGYVYQIMFDGRANKDALTPQEKRILSTFKFIPSTSSGQVR